MCRWAEGNVQDEVDTSELLEALHGGTEDDTAEVAAWRPSTTEAVKPGRVHVLHLVAVVGNQLGQFLLHKIRLLGLSTKRRQCFSGLFDPVFLDVVTRRLGKQSKTAGQNQRPEEL